MVFIKRNRNNRIETMRCKRNPHSLLFVQAPGRIVWRILKKKKNVEFPYGSVTPHLSIYQTTQMSMCHNRGKAKEITVYTKWNTTQL